MARRRFIDLPIADESQNRRYLVRCFYAVDEYDPGDLTTPAFSGDVVLEDLEVREATQFDFQGQAAYTDHGIAAGQYADRVWQLLDTNSALREQIEAACWEDREAGQFLPRTAPKGMR